MTIPYQENSILFEKSSSGVATIIFNRPEVYNAMTMAMYKRVRDLIWQCEQDEEVKVIVFRGNGKAFCSGQDVDDAYNFYFREGDDTKRRPSMRRRLLTLDGTLWGKHGLVEVVAYCLKPTVAMIHHRCFGSALGILMGCDIAVASDDTLFGHPGFTYHGFGGDLGSYIIHIGLKRAKRFTLTSRPFNAQKAYDWGLINEIVPMDELESTTNEIIDDLLKMPFDALVMQKAYYRTVIDAMGMGTNFDAALQTLAFASNIRYEPGENVMVRDRQKGGASAAIKSRKKHYGHL